MSTTTLIASRPTNTVLARFARRASAVAILGISGRSLEAQQPTAQHGNWQGSVGVVGGSVASYYGADARRSLGAPLVGLVYKQRLLIGTNANGGLGGGAELLLERGVVGASVGLTGVESRPEGRADVLAGMDDRSGAAFGTGTLSLHVGPAVATTTTLLGLKRDAGVMQTLGLQVGGAIAPRFKAGLGGAVTFASRDNMGFDFGISREQAERRRDLIEAGDGRLREGDAIPFAPKGGFKELRGTAQMAYALQGNWQAVGIVTAGRLAHGVSQSPLARKRSAVTLAAGVAYGF